MPTVIVGQENSAYIEIHYSDHGAGQPAVGCDTFAADLAALMEHLDLHDAVLVGHSMGTGEVTRYLSSHGSATATVAPIPTWATDFRADLPDIDVPVLVLQGDADQVLPLDKTGRRLPGLIHDVRLTVIEGGPHAIPWTHADQVNTALLGFIRS
jgi:pimeloyl-ACP methyl ester carboxylesterase